MIAMFLEYRQHNQWLTGSGREKLGVWTEEAGQRGGKSFLCRRNCAPTAPSPNEQAGQALGPRNCLRISGDGPRLARKPYNLTTPRPRVAIRLLPPWFEASSHEPYGRPPKVCSAPHAHNAPGRYGMRKGTCGQPRASYRPPIHAAPSSPASLPEPSTSPSLLHQKSASAMRLRSVLGRVRRTRASRTFFAPCELSPHLVPTSAQSLPSPTISSRYLLSFAKSPLCPRYRRPKRPMSHGRQSSNTAL